MKITLDGLPPSKKNSKRVFKAGAKTVVLSSIAYGSWHNQNILRLKQHPTFEVAATVDIIFHRKSKRRHNLDNMATSVLDLLVDA